MRVSPKSLCVEEFHGLYGPYNVSELLLQRIWLKGAFDVRGLKDQRGRVVSVEFPGAWNRLDGPDFKGAVFYLDGEKVEGDVEIHFTEKDWNNHGHQHDDAYSKVALHVVYHPVADKVSRTITSNGIVVPTVSLMDLLWYGLEEYANDDSIVSSSGTDIDGKYERLLELSLDDRKQRLKEFAEERWRLKLHFARLRISKLGWVGACHQLAMEILGYGFNRVPMLLVASKFPIHSLFDGSLSVDELWEAGEGRWKTRGTRPANHPRIRLAQYIHWVAARPCWPELLADLANQLPEESFDDARCGREFRKTHGLSRIRERIANVVFDNQISGSKVDTLICDGFLPLLANRSQRDFQALWFHWFGGNAPENCLAGLKRLQVVEPRKNPMSNGWIQAALRARDASPSNTQYLPQKSRTL